MRYIYGIITGIALTLFVQLYGLENLIDYVYKLILSLTSINLVR